MIPIMLALAIAVTTAVPAFAQSAGGPANPVSQAIREAWEGARRNITESAEMMPEAEYGFRPVETVRTFGAMLAHVAGANYVFCAAAKGEKSPHAEDEFEKTAKTKAAIVKALNESMAYCDTAYNALTDATAAQMVPQPFGGSGQVPRASPLMGNTGHLQEHYGNLVTYFRIKGMVPPSTARQQ